jgi:hypothetical protein
VPPLEFFNLESLFHSVVIYLTYSPHYNATGCASPDSPPAPASLENPSSVEHWLYSVAGSNAVRGWLAGGWLGGWLLS